MTDGDAPPVLLLHGFGTSAARTWGENGWIDIVGDMGRTVIAPDLLGHGSSAKPHDPVAYRELGPLVAAELPAEPVDAVAFSLGARILLGLAIEDPSRFRRLVVAGAGANLLREGSGDNLIQQALRGEVDRTNPVARYFAALADDPESDPLALAALLDHHQGPLDPDDLAKVTCPTLVVIGENDFAGPGDPLVDALPDARLVVLPRTDHFATPKDFRFMDATIDFLGMS
ncbi:MAG TPA: alpha/beta hydrolase [Acidimicrobiales bacterium]|nr:alpha/beta hydrolase [Acidimicrobiales bacterium]